MNMLWLYRFECLRAMCSAISMGPRGMVRPIAVAVLENLVMTNKDGALPSIHMLALISVNFEGI